MYAIVRTGGKQYRVEEGRAVTVDRLPTEEGATVELSDVLLIADDGQVTIGTPTIEGARVLAQVEANGRAKKIIVFKYKSKVRTRKKTGHRQRFTRLAVSEILRPGQQPKEAEKPKRRRRRKAAPVEEAPAAAAAGAVEEPAAAEAPAPKRRTRRAPAAKAEAPAPKRRTRRTPAAKAPAPKRTPRRKTQTGAAESAPAGEVEKKPPATRRRATRRKTETE